MESAQLLEAADKLFSTREYAQARATYEQALDAAVKEENRQVQVEALSQIARCWSLAPDLEQGRVWLARAQELASEPEPLGWTRYLGVRGIFEREAGERAQAKATFSEMYAYATKQKLYVRAIDAAHHVAIVAEPVEQVEWAQKGIAAAELAKDERWLAVLWNNLGATYEDLKAYDRCLEAYLKAREYHHKVSDETAKLAADWAVGRGYRFSGKLDEAKAWQTKTLAWARRRYEEQAGPQHAEWVGYALQEMGEILAAEGQAKEALEQLKESRKYWVEGGHDQSWPEGFKQLEQRISELAARPRAWSNGLAKLAGSDWSGTGELWLDPMGDQAQRSDCSLRIEAGVVRYTWQYEGKEQRGEFRSLDGGAVLWSDTWHQPKPTECRVVAGAWGLLTVHYTYPFREEHWGWRMGLCQRQSGELVLQMTNITSWGEEARAVRMVFKRK